jgi:SAM-dependent methyltransferase
MPDDDVPSGIDLRKREDATVWAQEADQKRPWRVQIRSAIASSIQARGQPRVLELGPGPGLLAELVLQSSEVAEYTLLDFSAPMLEMSRARLGPDRPVRYVLGDFTDPTWPALLSPPYDVVVAMQSVHELRHKRHAPALYTRIFDLLAAGGLLLVCDHSPQHLISHRANELHSTAEDQHRAMASAGFVDVRTELELNGLYLCSARRPS